MKLVACFVVWDDHELLHHAIRNIQPVVDGVIVIYSTTSNFGEFSEPPKREPGVDYYQWEPDLKMSPRDNETNKRNFALSKALQKGYTHFLMMDADEFYDRHYFLNEKKRFDDPEVKGLVCRLQCYFAKPTFTIGFDTTLVPFIHVLTPQIQHAFNKHYPFAWTTTDRKPFTDKKAIRIDPTRSLNINSGVYWSEIVMHHYSWCRKDFTKKIRNSTARANIEKSTVLTDLLQAKDGYHVNFYDRALVTCPNKFNLPEF